MITKILESEIFFKNYQNAYPKTLYQKLFVKALEKMVRGKLIIYLSDDKAMEIGKDDGKEPAKIFVKKEKFFKHCVLYGEIGFGESYMYNYFTTDNLYRLLEWFLENIKNAPNLGMSNTKKFFINLLGIYNIFLHKLRTNSPRKARKNISYHYDVSNHFYKLFLDPTLTYSSAMFSESNYQLETAQIEKYKKICRKLNLRPGLKVLEIGSGWGGFSKYIVENYGCDVFTITISQEQYHYVLDMIEQNPHLKDKLQIQLLDFRKLDASKYGTFDRIVSIEMAEALGIRYYDVYFKTIQHMLKDDGLVLIQYINYPEAYFPKYVKSTDFINKHIFPGGQLLSHLEVLKSLHRVTNLCLYDLDSFGNSYAQTLKYWKKNFINNLDKIIELNFDGIFIRKWYYYLTICELAFRKRYINVCQVLLSRPMNANLMDGYAF